MKYETLEAYVQAHGYKLSDFTEEEKKEIEEEWLTIKDGRCEMLDGFFSPAGGFFIRMIEKGLQPNYPEE